MIRVAVLTPDVDARDAISEQLDRQGFRTLDVADVGALATHAAGHGPELLVVDPGSRDEEGLHVCVRLRAEHPRIAVVMLGARAALVDRLRALQSGADAYLVKPVDPRELASVINGLCRRTQRDAPEPHWRLDVVRKCLHSPDGESVSLTSTETELLRTLADGAPAAVPRPRLAGAMGHPEPDFDHRRLESAISRLRRKLQAHCRQGSPVQAARGVGYLFAAPIRVRGDRTPGRR